MLKADYYTRFLLGFEYPWVVFKNREKENFAQCCDHLAAPRPSAIFAPERRDGES